MTIAASVENFLTRAGVHYEVLAHHHTSNSTHSAQAAHISGSKLAKCVMLEDGEGYVMAVLPATHRVDLEALRQELERDDLDLAAEGGLAGVFTDCEPGALPPLGEAYGVDVVVDQSLVGASDVYFEGGDHCALIHVRGNDFLKLMGGAPRRPISRPAQ